MDLGEFVEKLVFFGLEHFRKFYGVYRGNVTRNDDPEKRGRIQVIVPGVGHNRAPDLWVEPAFDGAGRNRGSFWPPEVGDSVRVAFERGDASLPTLYWGGWFGNPKGVTEVPPELGHTTPSGGSDARTTPTARGLVTRAGHLLVFEDGAGDESVTIQWHQPASGDSSLSDPTVTADRSKGSSASIVLDKTGSVVLTNKNGSKLALDASGKTITLLDKDHQYSLTIDQNGIKVKAAKVVIDASQIELGSGADTPALRGKEVFDFLLNHKHLSPWGTTTPPVPPPLVSLLSKVVKLA